MQVFVVVYWCVCVCDFSQIVWIIDSADEFTFFLLLLTLFFIIPSKQFWECSIFYFLAPVTMIILQFFNEFFFRFLGLFTLIIRFETRDSWTIYFFSVVRLEHWTWLHAIVDTLFFSQSTILFLIFPSYFLFFFFLCCTWIYSCTCTFTINSCIWFFFLSFSWIFYFYKTVKHVRIS